MYIPREVRSKRICVQKNILFDLTSCIFLWKNKGYMSKKTSFRHILFDLTFLGKYILSRYLALGLFLGASHALYVFKNPFIYYGQAFFFVNIVA